MMQSRFTAKGVTSDDKKVLLAYELKEDEFKVDLYIIPQKGLAKGWEEKLEKEWTEGADIEFPKATEFINPNLHAESILPDNILSDETGKIRGKQNEWAFQLLTAKLWESYLLELESLKKKATELVRYDRQLFDDAKSFWERVLEHRKEKDISQERLDKIKEDVNSIFEKLKTFRKTESVEFETTSAALRDEVLSKLESIKNRADDKANFKELLEELKTVQHEGRRNRYTKADDVQVRKIFDATFQYVNEQRNHFFSDKTASRIKGLAEVIHKMEASLNRDKKDIERLEQQSKSSHVQSFELQLIHLKVKMLNETIASKEEKLKDIYSTMENLQKQASKGQQNNSNPKQAEKIDAETTSAQEANSTDQPNPSAGE